MWIGIDDAEILIEEDLLFEKERVDLRVSFLGEGATARAKDKVWDDAIISVFFLNIYIYVCVCVCVAIYNIYVYVKWRFFSPSKEGTIERKTHTRVRFTLSLSPSLDSLFTLSLSVSKKRKKKSNQKGAGFFPLESHTILHLFVSHVIILLRGIILSLRVYSKERVGEKGEDKRV